MKTVNFLEWDDLAKETKDKLLEEQFDKELEWMVQYGVGECDDKSLEKAVNKCIAEMEKKQTPWFLAETLRDNPIVKSYLEGVSLGAMEIFLFYRWSEDTISAYPEFFDV